MQSDEMTPEQLKAAGDAYAQGIASGLEGQYHGDAYKHDAHQWRGYLTGFEYGLQLKSDTPKQE